MRHNYTPTAVVVAAFLVLFLISCDIISSPSPGPRPLGVATLAATATPAADAPSLDPDLVTPNPAGAVVLTLKVAEIPDDLPGYDRDDWRHWRDEDRDCQDARQEVLVAESLTPVEFKTSDQCKVLTGSWIGPYTGTPVDDPSRLDVDHMVPLANAHRSGGWAWPKELKAEYANSLDYDDHLIATTRAANRAKGSDGPEDWRPPDESYWCDYAIDWITIKHNWGLTATVREVQALGDMLEMCVQETILQTE